MKFKFMKTTILTMVMCISSVAHAGLILGDKEYMALGLTTSKTNAQIDAMILADSALSGYALATDLEAALLWSSIPGTTHNDIGWHAINFGTASLDAQNIMNYFLNGHVLDNGGTTSFLDPHGMTIQYNRIAHGHLRYRDAITGLNESGYFNLMALDLTPTGAVAKGGSHDDITDIATTYDYFPESGDSHVHSLYVRTVNVPESSTLAIFALGMIGLASRRFKKES